MPVRREIVLPLSGDLKRVLIQSLAKYKEELKKQREALPVTVGLKRLLIQGEEKSAEEAIELIQEEWKSALPTVMVSDDEKSRKQDVLYELCRIERQEAGVLCGFTQNHEMVTVIYDMAGFFDTNVGNQRVLTSPEVQMIGEEFLRVCE